MAAGAIMALAAKRLAHRDKRSRARSATVAAMKDRTTSFVLTQLRCEDETIVEVKGRSGFWPLRRPVRYRLGSNCDSITVIDGHLVVHREGNPIATADLQHPGALRWAWLLHPRRLPKDPSGPPPHA